MERRSVRAPAAFAVVLWTLSACGSGTPVGAEPTEPEATQEESAEPTPDPTVEVTTHPAEPSTTEPAPSVGADGQEWPPASTTVTHGSEKWATYVAVTPTADDPAYTAAQERLEELGYPTGGGEVGCDRGAAEALGVDPSAISVAVYFDTRADAETFSAMYGPEVVGTALVTTLCLD